MTHATVNLLLELRLTVFAAAKTLFVGQMRAVLLFVDKSKTFSRSCFYKGFLLFCRTCSVANMVAGALTRKQLHEVLAR